VNASTNTTACTTTVNTPRPWKQKGVLTVVVQAVVFVDAFTVRPNERFLALKIGRVRSYASAGLPIPVTPAEVSGRAAGAGIAAATGGTIGAPHPHASMAAAC
jgi:hypothetical protein